MGIRERYTVQFEDGTMRTVVAMSHAGAKREFMDMYRPPKGARIVIWPQSNRNDRRNMRI